MAQPIHNELGRRERQIMDVIYRLGRASVAEVRENVPDPPTYSAVRAMLGFLEDKGYLRHERDGMKYVYLPTVDAKHAGRSALQHMVKTFFNGSAAQAAAALIEMNDTQLSTEEIKRLSDLIKKARQEGR
ncbi:MAG TPA: BlaI/MecI/CopY family transcriptional regulator [Terriglobales bacterium]